jgi:hypothetical protein
VGWVQVGLFLVVFVRRGIDARAVHTTVVKTGMAGLHGNKVWRPAARSDVTTQRRTLCTRR